jgi:dipeptidyl aminopeptidase/acylaminoacyl peptidase
MAALATPVLLLGAGGPAHPGPGGAGLEWSQSGRSLAFWCDSGLYSVNMVQGGVVRLTSVPARGRCSPDGLRVAWSDRDATYVYHAGSTGDIRIAEPGRVAGWSPDSKWVLVEACPPRQAPEIYAASADGKGASPLAPHPAWDGDATCSPDGRWIAFVSQRDAQCSDIWVVGWDGSHLSRVTAMFEANAPAWSPDGSRLAFCGRATASSPRQVYWLDFRTRKLTAVTPEARGDVRDPRFVGPDYLTYVGGTPEIVDLRSGARRELPRGELSPDGRMAAVLSGRPGSLDVIPLAGGDRRPVDKGVEACAWSPDGRWLAYLALSPGPTGGVVRELRVSALDSTGVCVLWSEGLSSRGGA